MPKMECCRLAVPQDVFLNPKSMRARAARPYIPQSQIRNPQWLHSTFRNPHSDYFPFHCGVRLFRKAEIPSRASSVRALRAIISLA